MQRSSWLLPVVFTVLLFSCDFAKKSKELVFNRYTISTPSMSPNLNVGETYPAFTSDSFQINQAVIYTPIKRLRIDNEKVVCVHRLVGKPGDYLEMKKGALILNNEEYPYKLKVRHSYRVSTTAPLSEAFLEKFEDVQNMGMQYQVVQNVDRALHLYHFFLTPEEVPLLKQNKIITEVVSMISEPQEIESTGSFFVLGNNKDNWGPFKIPRRGDRITITAENQKLYETIFSEHEGNSKPSIGEEKTILKDYYFVLGDNRHNSLDSRYTGVIPQDRMKAYLVIDQD